MRVLVTGATGFLGGHLVGRLRHAGADVLALGSRDANLTEPGTLTAAAPGAFDRVYHLAAWTQAGDFCLRHPGEQWIINQQINTQVLSWWRDHQPQALFVSMGTSCSYDPALPLTEDNYLRGTPIESLFTYAMTKRMLHVGQMSLAQQFGMKYLTVVPSTLYGPGYHRDDRQPHFIFDLVRKIVRGVRYGDPVILWGDGHQRREVVWVADFVEALESLVQFTNNEIVNVGAGEDHSIREFAELICRHVGFDPAHIQYDTARYVGARSKRLDTRREETLLPGLRRMPLESGLKAIVAECMNEMGAAAP